MCNSYNSIAFCPVCIIEMEMETLFIVEIDTSYQRVYKVINHSNNKMYKYNILVLMLLSFWTLNK